MLAILVNPVGKFGYLRPAWHSTKPIQIRAMAQSAVPPSSFHGVISRDPSASFPAVPGRYHLYISYACPWASRCFTFLKIKGLDEVISYTVVKPKWEKTKEGEDHSGWVFATSETEESGALPDPVNGAKSIRALYELANPALTSGKFSVPVLWDKKLKTIVNNESGEIIRMFNSEFNEFAKNPDLDLYPPHLRTQIDEINDWVLPNINSGVYKSGFSQTQESYEANVKTLFESLERTEEILSKQRYLCGNTLTEADIRLFVTLVRFDEVYAVHFKCNKKLIREYPNLFNYTKDIYQFPGVSDTVNIDHIKRHYYGSHPWINPVGLVPVGSNIDYSAPHDRARFTQ